MFISFKIPPSIFQVFLRSTWIYPLNVWNYFLVMIFMMSHFLITLCSRFGTLSLSLDNPKSTSSWYSCVMDEPSSGLLSVGFFSDEVMHWIVKCTNTSISLPLVKHFYHKNKNKNIFYKLHQVILTLVLFIIRRVDASVLLAYRCD